MTIITDYPKCSKKFYCICLDLARRYKRFHANESYWPEMWGLARISEIRGYVNRGMFQPTDIEFYYKYRTGYESRYLIWFFPSNDTRKKFVIPLINNMTLEEIEKEMDSL